MAGVYDQEKDGYGPNRFERWDKRHEYLIDSLRFIEDVTNNVITGADLLCEEIYKFFTDRG